MTGGPAQGSREAYDAIADAYDEQLGDELDHKPLDRGLLAAVADLARGGTLADVGCGPGHVTRFLAELHSDVVGVDLSPRMIEIAGDRAPALDFTVASMTELPVADDAWAGAVALYSIIHLNPADRAAAFRELARVLRPDGVLLVAFHVDSVEFGTGEVNHLHTWFGKPVDLDALFLDTRTVAEELRAAGFAALASMHRQPEPDVEYPSRRAYLLVTRR